MSRPSTSGDKPEDDEKELELVRRISHQAVDEGHDADMPSGEGFIHTTSATGAAGRTRRKSNALPEEGTTMGSESRDIEKEAGASTAPSVHEHLTNGHDPNVVWWDENDPENPYNWPTWRTMTNSAFISLMTFVTPLASSIFAPGVPQLMQEFKSDSLEMASFVVSVYILGFAFGPLLMAPLSEVYGRLIVYHVCNVGFIVFVVACARAPTLDALVVFRFFSGVFGSCPVANGGGSIADMIPQERRAIAMAGFSVGPLLGPIVGPIAGGFLADAKGWRWNFWLLAIVQGVIAIVMLFTMKETFHPVLLQRKVNRLRKETGNESLRSKLDAGLSPADYFKRSIVRPLKMICLSPIVTGLSIFIGITYGYLYLMFTSMTEVFEQYYGFSTSLVGLAYIGLGVGSLSAVFIYSGTSDRYMRKKAAEADAAAEASGGVKEGMKPEYRLPMLPVGAIMLPIGLFIYGWTAEKRVHWIAPIIGTGIIGAANLILMMAVQMYLIDAFTIYAASAIAANTVIRSVAGAVLPLAGLKMYARLGVGWGNSLLGFIALLLIPASFLVIKYGERIRKRYELKNL